MTGPRWTVGLVLLGGVLLIAAGLAWGHRVTVDSASYIESAMNLMEGRGLQHRRWGGLSGDFWEPLYLWPPGYPLLILSGIAIGLEPIAAALAVAAMSMTAALVLLWRWFDRMLPPGIAVAALLFVAVMPMTVRVGSMAWSDGPHFAATLGSLWCLLRWSDEGPRRGARAFASGVLAVSALAVRFVGLALAPTIALFIALEARRLGRLRVLRGALSCGVGVVVVLLPLLWIHPGAFDRLLGSPGDVFSERTLTMVVADLAGTIAAQLLARQEPLEIPLWGPLALVGLIALVLTVGAARGRPAREEGTGRVIRREIMLPALYAASYLPLLLLGATDLSRTLDLGRFLVPVLWVIVALGCLVAGSLLRRVPPRVATLIVISILLLGAAGQARRSRIDLGWLRANVPNLIGADVARSLAERIAPEQLVLATRPQVLRIHADRHARHMMSLGPGEAQSDVGEELMAAFRSGLLWGLVFEESDLESRDYGSTIRSMVEDPARYGLTRLELGVSALVLEYRGPR